MAELAVVGGLKMDAASEDLQAERRSREMRGHSGSGCG